MLKLEQIQKYFNQLVSSTPIARKVSMLAGGTNTQVFLINTTHGDDIVARKASGAEVYTFTQTHELEKWISANGVTQWKIVRTF